MIALVIGSFVFAQVFILFILQEDSANPTCTKHSDHQPGWMCNGFGDFSMRQPRCEPCANLNPFEDLCDVDVVDLEYLLESTSFGSDETLNVGNRRRRYFRSIQL